MAESEYRCILAVLRPGTQEVMAHHATNQAVTPGMLFDPHWWGVHPPAGKRLVRVVRVLAEADWPETQRDQTHPEPFTVVEVEWI